MSRAPKLYQLLISLFEPVIVILGLVPIGHWIVSGVREWKSQHPRRPLWFPHNTTIGVCLNNFRCVREGQPMEALAAQPLGDQTLYNQRELIGGYCLAGLVCRFSPDFLRPCRYSFMEGCLIFIFSGV
jgi:hypothetical protein